MARSEPVSDMVSRERVLRIGATLAEHATTRRVRVLAQFLLVAALVFVVLRARSLWQGSHIDWSKVDWAALAGASLLGAAGTVAGLVMTHSTSAMTTTTASAASVSLRTATNVLTAVRSRASAKR